MGLLFTCQKVECEEEILQRILSTMQLTYIDSKPAYVEFLKCIDEDGAIHYFRFQKYLSSIIGINIYKAAQKEFFENLFKATDKSIRIIGAIIIFLSKGSKTEKIDLLRLHFTNYYQGLNDEAIKTFIGDIIDANTDNCIVSFKNNMSVDLIKNMCDAYQSKLKRKLEGVIMDNYDGVKSKYIQQKGKNEIYLEGNNLYKTTHNNNPLVNNCFTDIDRLNNSFADCQDNEVKEKYMKIANEVNFGDVFNNEDKVAKKEKILKEFLELSFSQLSGEFIRNWLYDEYIKDKQYDNSCI